MLVLLPINPSFSAYFWEIAETGHVPMHVPQSMQTLSSHWDFPLSSRDSAETGQTPVQAPQPMQRSLSTVTGIV
jgi:hypothetical protein